MTYNRTQLWQAAPEDNTQALARNGQEVPPQNNITAANEIARGTGRFGAIEATSINIPDAANPMFTVDKDGAVVMVQAVVLGKVGENDASLDGNTALTTIPGALFWDDDDATNSYVQLEPATHAGDSKAYAILRSGATAGAAYAQLFSPGGFILYGATSADGAFFDVREMTAPAAPIGNWVRIFAQDNGAGKTQLMALFSSGAAQQIAIQP